MQAISARFVAPVAPAQRRHQVARRQQRLQPLAVAQMEEPQVQAEAQEAEGDWDKESAYARFEQLLESNTYNFRAGDKVWQTQLHQRRRRHCCYNRSPACLHPLTGAYPVLTWCRC
jgi:hypothetical protein